MIKNLGSTFKLIRNEHEMKLNEVAQLLGITRTALIRFENTSRGVSKDLIEKYKEILNIKETISKKDIEDIELLMGNLFDDIFYLNRNYRKKFNELQNLQSKIANTEYYPLVYIFDFCLTVQDNAIYSKITDIKVKKRLDELCGMIHLVEKYLPTTWLSLFYDYLGERERYQYHMEEALDYYMKAEKMANDDRHLSLINYRKALAYTQVNMNSRALEVLEKAKIIFDKYLNYEKSLSAEFLKAMIYDNMKDYDMAIMLYERCLKVVEQGKYSLSKQQIYNNILWALLMKGDYNKMILLSQKALDLETNVKAIYLYLAWGYYASQNIEQAKFYLNKCNRSFNDFFDPSYDTFLNLLNYIIKNDYCAVEEFESKLNQNTIISGTDTLLLVYTMLVQYYKNSGNIKKTTEYLQKLYQI